MQIILVCPFTEQEKKKSSPRQWCQATTQLRTLLHFDYTQVILRPGQFSELSKQIYFAARCMTILSILPLTDRLEGQYVEMWDVN